MRSPTLQNAAPTRALVDVGAGIGLFLEAAKTTTLLMSVIGIEPGRIWRASAGNGAIPLSRNVPKMFCRRRCGPRWQRLSEVFEHLYDPGAFIRSMANIVVPDGWSFSLTLSVTGFDLQVLWDRSKKHITATPHQLSVNTRICQTHLNVAVSSCLTMTPGRLDVDIVRIWRWRIRN